MGDTGARAVQSMLENAAKPSASRLATVAGLATSFLGSTGAFLELQTALNAIWRVKPRPSAGIKAILFQRLVSFGLVIGVGFVLLVSLVVSAGLAALDHYIGNAFPAIAVVWTGLNVLVSLGVITLLFAMIYQFLPDVDLALRDVWVGALVTAGLFSVGKNLIGLYLGTSAIGSSYGAAGSVVVLLVWVYYSAQVVLLGAEFTRAYVEHFEARRPRPMAHAKRDPAPEATGGRRNGGTAVGRRTPGSRSTLVPPYRPTDAFSPSAAPPPPPERTPASARAAGPGRTRPGSSPGAPR
jgi:membrane protein